MTRVVTSALARAAELIGAALGVAVASEPIGALDPEESPVDETKVAVSLSEGTSSEGEYLLGSATPYEFEHQAVFELVVAGSDEATRAAKRDECLMATAAAIAADPTLSGLVDFAELTSPDVSAEERFAGVTATLTLLYSAPTALG